MEMPEDKWKPITDLGDDPRSLTDWELDGLQTVWADQKKLLAENGTLQTFEDQLRREWSIETGIIERVYTLDRGTTRTLIERGIDAALIPHGASDRDSTDVARIIQDHHDALEGMFDFVGGPRQLSSSYIKELHAALLKNQDTYRAVDQFGQTFDKALERGAYKTEPNSPTQPDGTLHEYCPPEHVAAEMDNLVQWHLQHTAKHMLPEVEAAWLHHRFTQIHPFADGNGRVARALASLVFIKANWFPLVVKRDDWTRYIDALEKADRGDLRDVVSLFVEAQRGALIQASEIAFEAQPPDSTEKAIAALRDRLVQRGQLPAKEWLKAKATASTLVQSVHHRLGQLVEVLNQEITSGGTGTSFGYGGMGKEVPDVRKQAIRIGGQNPDFDAYNMENGIVLSGASGISSQLRISFQALGPKFYGLIGVVAYLTRSGDPSEPVLLKEGTFQINYAEDLKVAEARFTPWLERVIVETLNYWRRLL
jgi:Fic family protein